MRRVLSMGLVVCMFFAMAISACMPGDFTKDASVSESDRIGFVSEVLEKYYRNKDLGEDNDLSSDVSQAALLLLETKIELGQMQKEILEINYQDYRIEILPFDTEKWEETEKGFSMTFQVNRTWLYEDNDELTSNSELQEVNLSKNADGSFTIESCYNLHESIDLGPIDDVYKNSLQTQDSDGIDTILNAYKAEFEKQCTEKKEQMDKDTIQ